MTPSTCLVLLAKTSVSRCFICELAFQPRLDTTTRKLMVVPETMHDLAYESQEWCLWELSTWIVWPISLGKQCLPLDLHPIGMKSSTPMGRRTHTHMGSSRRVACLRHGSRSTWLLTLQSLRQFHMTDDSIGWAFAESAGVFGCQRAITLFSIGAQSHKAPS